MFVATIGFFDGVHLGHRCLIDQVLEVARGRGLQTMVVTMDRHPKCVIAPQFVPSLLTTNEERRELLTAAGIDRIEFLHFDSGMMLLTARDFMQRVLKEQLGVGVLVMGYDHKFGHGGGSFEQYLEWGRECGIEVVRARELPGMHASSTECRRFLMAGDIAGAEALLGHPFCISGTVVEGHKVGREMGFPTANIEVCKEKLVPKDGVYAVMVNGSRRGILNIGTRPTLDNGNDRTIEVHLIGYRGNLYGERLTIQFARRIRDERKFDSMEELKAQIRKDLEGVNI